MPLAPIISPKSKVDFGFVNKDLALSKLMITELTEAEADPMDEEEEIEPEVKVLNQHIKSASKY
jgi:hypothetical protein